MKKGRALTTLSVAVAMGLGAVWIANNWLRTRMAAAEQTDDGRVSVLVAAREIPFGKQIEEVDLRTVSLPEDAIPEAALRQKTDAVGKMAIQTIYTGEVVMSERVAMHMGGSALAAVIAPNKRAIAVRVNDVVGVAGFLLPGNRVDVIATRRQGNNKSFDSRTLLENIKVLAVDQRASPDKNEPTVVRAVTLELAPREAESLVKATQEGSVQLALRNPTDTAKALRAAPAKMVVQAPRPPVRKISTAKQVTVIRGLETSKTRVEQ